MQNDEYLESLSSQLHSLKHIKAELGDAKEARDRCDELRAEVSRLQRDVIKFQNVKKTLRHTVIEPITGWS